MAFHKYEFEFCEYKKRFKVFGLIFASIHLRVVLKDLTLSTATFKAFRG